MKRTPDLRFSSLSLVILSAFYVDPVQAQTCQVGQFSLTGNAPCEFAPVGTFVNVQGATAPTPAPPGRYVPTTGSTAALDAPPGTFVPTSGQSEATPAPLGFFVDTFGATAATPAPPGKYVPTTGSAAALIAPLGTFVPTSGQSEATPAPLGFFVDTVGATAATPAPPGMYVPTTGSTAALIAPLGTFVPTSGQSEATLAPLGFFVDTVGATAATPAPVGMYVATVGQTAATFAPAGRYVAVSGSSAPSTPDAGFYSYAPGASQQVSAGLVAAPMNTTIRSVQASLDSTHELIRTGASEKRLRASTYYQTGKVDQTGLTNNAKQSISLWGLSVVADIAGEKDNATGVFAGLTVSDFSADSDGSGHGLGFNLGAYKQLQVGAANILGSISYGSFDYDTTRTNISQGTVLGQAANIQTASSSSRVTVFAANVLGEMPLHAELTNFVGFADLGIAGYHSDGYDESVAVNGSDPSAGLDVKSASYLSIPLTVGLRYTIRDAGNQSDLFSVVAGYRYDFGSSETISFSSQSVSNVQFGTPVLLTNKGAFFASLSSANYEVSKNLYLNASLSTELSSSYEFFQASLNLTKRF